MRLNIRGLGHSMSVLTATLLFLDSSLVAAIHHMKLPISQDKALIGQTRPLSVVNRCTDVIYPGIATQAGEAPVTQGFRLNPGETRDLTVGANWQGRVWGRTNCSFNDAGTAPATSNGINIGGVACGTGDCGGTVNCQGTGVVPVTLAEFTLASQSGQTFYDISLVDGYNLPLGIIALWGSQAATEVPPNLTNPICIATSSFLGGVGNMDDEYSGTNSSFPLPLEETVTSSDVARWCPWDLQVHPPSKPGDGVYPYPDDNIQRPIFDPCYSTCAKYNQPKDCCSGAYENPTVCKPSLYSQDAKRVCPDAYSYAFDDQTSTFIIPAGAGFQVTFCPAGRSTNILTALGEQLRAIASSG